MYTYLFFFVCLFLFFFFVSILLRILFPSRLSPNIQDQCFYHANKHWGPGGGQESPLSVQPAWGEPGSGFILMLSLGMKDYYFSLLSFNG